jgi:ethanolamine ammonia-lyase small subunit
MSNFLTRDPWENLRRLTPAPIALGRAGAGLPTKDVLDFSLRHARAHDAVLAGLEVDAVDDTLRAQGFETVRVRSAAPDRGAYLRRPDLGRRLHPDDAALLKQRAGVADIAIIVADGLSSAAIHAHAAAFLHAAKPHLARNGFRVAPVAIATQARVALGDEIGNLLRARLAIVLIGERPGLSSPDSLGVYLTYDPQIGRTDAERNCISNIRAAGLDYQTAAHRVFWLVEESLRLGKTGVALKDMSDLTALGSSRFL